MRILHLSDLHLGTQNIQQDFIGQNYPKDKKIEDLLDSEIEHIKKAGKEEFQLFFQ